jgi:uncharacterized damage-inducible protein DinB
MRYQDQVVKATHKALDDVCRAALAVPEEKASWKPMGEARSVLNQMQEIAVAGSWFLPLIRDRKVPEFDRHAMRESIRLRESYDSVDKCVEAARTSTVELCQAIAEFPDTELEREMQLPFGGGMTMTMADILSMHSWNMIYHLGQINYIQLMLGDKDMH